MADLFNDPCPDCDSPDTFDRRSFIRVLGGTTAALAVGGAAPQLLADAPATAKPAKTVKPAEALVKELFASLKDDQKPQAVYAWNHGAGKGQRATRLRMYNKSLGATIGKIYSKPQQDLISQIIKAISSGEEGLNQLTRKGTWDASGDLTNCGAHIFGDPTKGKYSWVLSGHHLTVRCDGNSEEGAAFGGPLYYGHSPNGYSDRNVFYYQTKAVLGAFDALDEKQRKAALIGNPGELEPSIRFKGPMANYGGIAYKDLSSDQKALIEKVMRTILTPFRKEDADEVMTIIKANGGMEKIHLGFFKEKDTKEGQWNFWRLEGPGFVWNFRVLPHVHTYVNISSKIV
jgi:hypothetical protein